MISKLFFDTPKRCMKIMDESPSKCYFAKLFWTNRIFRYWPTSLHYNTHDKFENWFPRIRWLYTNIFSFFTVNLFFPKVPQSNKLSSWAKQKHRVEHISIVVKQSNKCSTERCILNTYVNIIYFYWDENKR